MQFCNNKDIKRNFACENKQFQSLEYLELSAKFSQNFARKNNDSF